MMSALNDMLDADDRFFARLPPLSDIRGIGGRTPVARRPEPAGGG